MRNILVLLLLWSNLILLGATYYVDPSGSDSNIGSSSSPWKTLAYACTKAKASGDIIHINAGTFYESGQSNLAVGVSIVGAGMTSTIIESSYSGSSQPLIKLETSNGWLGTNGNQSISGIRFDGNMATFSAIDVNFRSNVLIHDNTFLDFQERAVLFVGQAEASYGGGQIPWDKDAVEGSFPNYWCSGNKFYKNIVTNCAIYDGAGSGNLRIGTQRGIQIYDNTITQTARAAGSNGYGIKYYGRGFNKGTKCYNNTITIAPQPSGGYTFALELWYEMDECEYYGNTIQGCIDVDACDKQGGAYALWFHDNILGYNSTQNHQEYAFDVEAYLNGLIINNNIIKYVSTGIQFSFIWPIGTHPGDSYYNDIHIYDNLMYGIGITGSGWSFGEVFGISFSSTRLADDITNMEIYNNTIVASGQIQSGTSQVAGIRLCDNGVTTNNVQIRNNIIKGFAASVTNTGPIIASGTSSNTNLKITNNLFYGNGNSNAVKWTGSFSPGTGYDNSSIITNDPLLASDYRLQAGSPAIGTGIAVGLSTDKSGIPWNTKPSIGAFESGSTATSPGIPLYQNSVVENATPSLLQINFNLALANITPAANAFSVSVNSMAVTPSAIAVSGSSVKLTLTSVIKYGDIISVSYTKPTISPLQTASAGLAASLGAQSVTNNVGRIDPVHTGSVIENTTPALLEMTYNISLASIVPGVSSFSVLVNSSVRTISAIAVSGTKVRLTLASRIVSGDIVTVSYVKPSSNYLQTSSAGIAASISNIPVSNKCQNAAPVAVLTSPVTNSSFTSPANISMTASASDPDGSVSLVEFYNGNTRIGSVSATPYSFSWNNVIAGSYSLTAVVTDNRNSKTVSSSITISVGEKKASTNRHPVIRISNPRKGNSYANISTVTIDAIASDPDGSVSKVEFYNGSERLVEVTTAPYSYIWKDVVPGSYKITAIATDNLNDTTMSSPVEFVVASNIKYDANSDIIKLYPNPNNGQFSVEFLSPLTNEKSEIVITDMAGKQVYNGPVLKEEIIKQFDLSGSRSGVYVMLIKDKDIFVTKKFIKN